MKTFDYSRSNNLMRFRDENGEVIMADRMAGRWEFQGEHSDGKLDVDCEVLQQGGTAYLYAKDGSQPQGVAVDGQEPRSGPDNHDSCLISANTPFPNGRDTHWRICYARELATQGNPTHWRLRDERTGELWFVKGYRGFADIDYMDRGSHIFVTGPAEVDEEGVAHFS